MHCLHWIAVEAEDVQDAVDLVDSALSNYDEGGTFASWSDWHIIGGGRWNVQEGESWQAAYVDGRTNMVISYKDNPDKFMEQLAEVRKYRVEEMTRLLADINIDRFMDNINSFIANNGSPNDEKRFDMTNYYVNKASDMLSETYTSSSYFFDLDNYTASLSYLPDRLEKNPEQQYLVPVDFHH